MSIAAHDLKRVAEELFPEPVAVTDEALRRACVNRKYYATYHYLLDVIEANFPNYIVRGDNRTFGNTGTHHQLFHVFDDIYKNSHSKYAQRVSLKFTNFLTKRHAADYHLNEDFSEFDYKQALKFAEDIPKLADELVKK